VSIDAGSRDQGGDLGWIPRGLVDQTLDKALSEVPVGQSTQPFESADGWHILQIIERDPSHPVTEAQRQTLALRGFENWVGDQRDDNPSVKQKLTSDGRSWVLRHVGVRP
jgi:parvulin-like peptidyl-prolyl isomerase